MGFFPWDRGVWKKRDFFLRQECARKRGLFLCEGGGGEGGAQCVDRRGGRGGIREGFIFGEKREAF